MTFLDVFLWSSNAPWSFFFPCQAFFGEGTTFLPTFVLWYCAVCIAWGFADTKHSQKMPILCSWKNAKIKTKPFIDAEGQFQAGIWILLEQITGLISYHLLGGDSTPKLMMQG